MSLGFIVQARTGSSRLKSKVLLKLKGQTILEHVIENLKKTKFKKKIIIATTKKLQDRKIAYIAKRKSCLYFLGSEKNVLERYFKAAKKFKIKTIIRICSDSPFIDHQIVEKGLKIYLSKKFDYVSNIINPTYPAGMSVEIFNFKSLKKSFFAKTDLIEKEHVTPYIYRNPNLFKIKNFGLKKNLTKYRFAIDYKEDYLLAKKIFHICEQKKIKKLTLKKLIYILDKNKKLKKINFHKKTSLRY